jgi:hypothetical protein
MQVNNKLTFSPFSLLPSNIVDDIYDFADKKAESKKYFQRNVLTLVDPTLCFLSNRDCDSCFLHDCKIRISGELGPFHGRVCFGCRKIRNGDVMVSAHSAGQQWRDQYKVLAFCGVEKWKQTIMTWTPCVDKRGGLFHGVDEEHPVLTAVKVYASALVKRRQAEKVLDVARSAMMIGY